MQIKFYYNSSEKNKINKSISRELTIDRKLRDECSVINRTILVEHCNLSNYNYYYIQEI